MPTGPAATRSPYATGHRAPTTARRPAAPLPPVDPRPPRDRAARPRPGPTRALRLLAILVLGGGLVLSLAGVGAWVLVTDQLDDEQIVVSDDAERFAGQDVDGPFTAFEQARTIREHVMAETDGQTYAQLDQDDPRRGMAETASFLRASLFTSVISFGVAAFSFGLGLLMTVVGLALLQVERNLRPDG